jgi:hypothetical protein
MDSDTYMYILHNEFYIILPSLHTIYTFTCIAIVINLSYETNGHIKNTKRKYNAKLHKMLLIQQQTMMRCVCLKC